MHACQQYSYTAKEVHCTPFIIIILKLNDNVHLSLAQLDEQVATQQQLISIGIAFWFLRVLHNGPVHPEGQLHRFTPAQIPPLAQFVEQSAKI